MERIKQMTNVVEWLQGKKAYIIAFATIVYAVVIVGWQNGDWEQATNLILGALGLSTLRAGITKSK